ncbi:hypothetical protein [Dyadobacter chenhuakuii]|uniref:Uncharacterized protein n=1 Tax=Dyadobacter chenhuakuii TaxID=2909339 RepID=A0A9X1TVU8_9BACT|nr:hypothetical protein [Dyadobacter chenhuakuii]MCF2501670.1 hypothetical protein [Dyadobacter chenhuakuii]
MHTNQNDESEDTLRLAYGRQVQELLSQSDAATWIEDLWQMYTGYTMFMQEAGHNPRGSNTFISFRELVFFFQDIEKMKN